MFIRLTQAEGGQLAIDIRANRIAAMAASEDGTRLFLGGALSVLVQESLDEVRAKLQGRDEDGEQG